MNNEISTSLLSSFRFESLRLLKSNPAFLKTGKDQGFVNITFDTRGKKKTKIIVGLKPLGRDTAQENRMRKFSVSVPFHDVRQVEELRKLALDFYTQQLGFYDYASLLTPEAAKSQFVSLLTEEIKKDPRYTFRDSQRYGYYSLGVSEKEARALTEVTFRISPMGITSGASLPSYFRVSLSGQYGKDIPSLVKECREYFESHGFFDDSKPMSEACLKAEIAMRLMRLKQKEPEIYNATENKYQGNFSIALQKSQGKDSYRRARLDIALHSPANAAASQWKRMPGSRTSIPIRSADEELGQKLKTGGIDFLKELGFHHRRLHVAIAPDRIIPKEDVIVSDVKLAKHGNSKNYYMKLSAKKAFKGAVYISTGTSEYDAASRCVHALRSEYLPRLIAAGDELTNRGIHEFLVSEGLSPLKPYKPKEKSKEALLPAFSFGVSHQPDGYVFFNVEAEPKTGIQVLISPTTSNTHLEARRIFLPMKLDNISAKLLHIMDYVRERMGEYFELGSSVTPSATYNTNAEHRHLAEQILKDSLRNSSNLFIHVAAERIADNESYRMQINPYFNFTRRDDFPYNSLSLIAPNTETASRFIIWAHEYVEKRLELEDRKVFPLPDDRLFAECIGGVLLKGKAHFCLSEDATRPLPEYLMRTFDATRKGDKKHIHNMNAKPTLHN